MTAESDYVTVLVTATPNRFLVAVMKWNEREDEYQLGKMSEPLPLVQAKALAESWAAALGLEVRVIETKTDDQDATLRSMFDIGSDLARRISQEFDSVPAPAAFHALAVLACGLIMSFDGHISKAEKLGHPLMSDADRIEQFKQHITDLLPIMRERVAKDGIGPKVM